METQNWMWCIVCFCMAFSDIKNQRAVKCYCLCMSVKWAVFWGGNSCSLSPLPQHTPTQPNPLTSTHLPTHTHTHTHPTPLHRTLHEFMCLVPLSGFLSFPSQSDKDSRGPRWRTRTVHSAGNNVTQSEEAVGYCFYIYIYIYIYIYTYINKEHSQNNNKNMPDLARDGKREKKLESRGNSII